MDLSVGTLLSDSKAPIDIDVHFKLFSGPGAGKTTFLVNHIKNIIRTSDKISTMRKIACITYTNIGVESIVSKLGSACENVEVSTIHSFLYKHVVKPYLWTLEDKYKFDLLNINGHDEVIATYSILKEWRTKTTQSFLNDDKELAKSLSNLTWILNDKKIELGFREPWHAKVGKYTIKKNSYFKYKEICWEKGLLSHDDILFLSNEIICENPRILEILRGKFPYILVDEFQDTNPIQSLIIKLIAEKETVVGVIGDNCQSIYSFQGADVEQFVSFHIPGMRIYYIEDNRRSTNEIINLLNHVRNQKSFIQKSPYNLQGEKPCVIIGDLFSTFEKIKSDCNDEKLYSLSYRKEVSNRLKYGIKNILSELASDQLLFEDDERGRMIFFTIYSIENCRQQNYKDGLKNMKKAYRKNKNFDDKDAFENMKRLLDDYSNISELNISDFYNNYLCGFYDTKKKISSGKKKEYYDNLTYKQVACAVNINEDSSEYRTIHKAKGDEFENVLLILNPSDFKENRDLEFLFNPDMNNEEHRVYYVGLSRAKKRLYISIPQVSQEIKIRLEEIKHVNVITV
ncbi:MAG: UvrD-helicase domain-containing protein [Zhenhengia sp.]|uniref:UvrD-helicase domain-containing protein n=1 Tax=Zhenhengia sp. TaxID=2944208 RepID=UPI0039952C26